MAKAKNNLGITVKKKDNFSEWYTQVIQKAELIDYTEVGGCNVFRPYSYAMWECAKDFFNNLIKKDGVKNAYFPMLIPEKLLNKEKEHVEGFSPEVAWVTHAGKSKLKEKLAIRPTSETLMYDSYKKWIRSWKDLPLRINQWCNIVRWEFKHPVPFLRNREFLWQEGHTVFATQKEAEKEVSTILDFYAKIFEELFAVPVLKGRKSEKEKFAGAEYTFSVESLLPNGKGIQMATSHFLAQNFSKTFDIKFLDKNEKNQYGWQNSWGFSTRSLGALFAIHGDDNGLVLPPKIAPNKVVIVPIFFKDSGKKVLKKANELKGKLKKYGVILDDREDYRPGWKFNEWELKGIPIRIELGPKDLDKKHVVLVRRDTGEKEFVKFGKISGRVGELLDEIQESLLNNAKNALKKSIVKVKDFSTLKKAVKSGNICIANWCGNVACEENIKDKLNGVKSLNIPFGQKGKFGKCAFCSADAKYKSYFGKSY